MSPKDGARAVGRPRPLHDRALGLLAVRPRGRKELKDRLLRAGFEETEVAVEIERLVAVGLVDDLAFARSLVEHHARSKLSGVKGVRAALRSRGIDAAIAERVISEMAGDDAARADALAIERARRMTSVPAEKAYPRLVALLLRRGHVPEVARAAARRALSVGSFEDAT